LVTDSNGLINTDLVVRASAVQLEDAGAVAFTPATNKYHQGAHLYLDVTASSGTSETLNVKVQIQDPASEDWKDLASAVFTEATGVTSQRITVGPWADATVKVGLPLSWRLLATVGSADTDGSFTYSLGASLV
jgi:hypothetical protein